MSDPKIGETVAPLPKIWFRFVHVIAACFVAYKLLPRDFPKLDDIEAPLSLSSVVREGWSHVRFTRETLPQTAAFFSVLAVLAFSAIAAFMALMSLAIGKAHAADAGMFDPAEDDAAIAWLEFLFNNASLPTFGQGDIQTKSFYGIQDAVTQALAFYSNAMLIIAALILFYHLASMIVETAHTGVPMGKRANQIWAPIRLVVAIGILVPINGGLNAGQYIVVKIAELGSGLASQTWDIFLTTMQNTKGSESARVPMVNDLAYNLMLSYACASAFDARLAHYISSAPEGTNLDYLNTYKITPLDVPTQIDNWNGSKTMLNSSNVNVCGWYFRPTSPSDPDSETNTTAMNFFNQLSFFNLEAAAAEIVKLIPESEGGTSATNNPVNSSLIKFAVRSLQANVQIIAKGLGKNAAEDGYEDVVETMKKYGWAFAGAYIATIERLQSQVGDALEGSLPTASGVDFGTVRSGSAIPAQIRSDVYSKDLVAFNKVLKKIYANTNLANINPNTTDINDASCDAMWGMSEAVEFGEPNDIIDDFSEDAAAMSKPGNFWNGAANFFGGIVDAFANPVRTVTDITGAVVNRATDAVIDIVLSLADKAATWGGVWEAGTGEKCSNGQSTFKLGVDLGSGTAVIQNLVSYGHGNVNAGLKCLTWAIMVLIGSGLAALAPPVGTMLAAIGSTGAMILFFLGTIFLIMGFVFAFVLPMVPFFRFFFAVIIWLGEVLEAVLAVPIIAIAHLSPEGDGLPGARAIDAYTSIFSIFLRPVLSVFGLIMGLLVFMVAANFMNYGFGLAVAATGGTSYSHGILAKFVFTAIYTYAVFVLANQSFALIDDFPKGAMEWMKAKASRTPDLGNYEKMQQYEQIVGGLLTKETVDFSKNMGDGMKKGVQAVGEASGGGGGGGGSEGDSSSGGSGGDDKKKEAATKAIGAV